MGATFVYFFFLIEDAEVSRVVFLIEMFPIFIDSDRSTKGVPIRPSEMGSWLSGATLHPL